MKKITLIVSLLVLCFTTGFTCSKNAPQQAAAPTEPTINAQAQMAAPADAVVTPVVPTETTPPVTETK